MWSMSMLTISAQSASSVFVASSRPPMPTSRIATSISRRAKYMNAATADDSKYDNVIEPSVESISRKSSTSSASVASAPLQRIRSLNRHRCGDVNVPTSKPACQ